MAEKFPLLRYSLKFTLIYPLVDPYYKKEFKAARKNGESGWAVINDRLRYERHAPHRGSRLP